MRSLLRALAALAATVVLAACATPIEIPYDRGAGIKTIGIATPWVSHSATVFLASSVGQSFGLIGALVDAGVQAHREEGVAHLLGSQHFVAADLFASDLKRSVEARGFAVTAIPLAREKAQFAKTYPAADGADAYLDVIVVDWGYLAAGISDAQPYRPFLIVKVRLVRASDNSVLMEDTVMYNPLNAPRKVVTVSPDPQYAFPDTDALDADAVKTTAGLTAAFSQTTDAVAALLH